MCVACLAELPACDLFVSSFVICVRRYDPIYYIVLCLRLCKQNVALRHLSSLLFLRHIFNVDTVVKPLPPSVAYNVSRNLTFTRIFTQFFGKFEYTVGTIVCFHEILVKKTRWCILFPSSPTSRCVCDWSLIFHKKGLLLVHLYPFYEI